MNKCEGCTMCCKLERIAELKKPRGEPCKFRVEGHGCNIYNQRPGSCQKFECWWLQSGGPAELRPDRINLYACDMTESSVRVMVDPEYPDAWKAGHGAKLIEAVTAKGAHALVVVGDQINFVGGKGKPRPEKLVVEWTL